MAENTPELSNKTSFEASVYFHAQETKMIGAQKPVDNNTLSACAKKLMENAKASISLFLKKTSPVSRSHIRYNVKEGQNRFLL